MKLSKGQFFIVATFIIVSILFTISKWIEPATILDVSGIASRDDIFIMNNIAEKGAQLVNGSKTCEELVYSLQEYKIFTESYAANKGYNLDLNYTVAPCPEPATPTTVVFNISLISPRSFLKSEFGCGWPEGCPI